MFPSARVTAQYCLCRTTSSYSESCSTRCATAAARRSRTCYGPRSPSDAPPTCKSHTPPSPATLSSCHSGIVIAGVWHRDGASNCPQSNRRRDATDTVRRQHQDRVSNPTHRLELSSATTDENETLTLQSLLMLQHLLWQGCCLRCG